MPTLQETAADLDLWREYADPQRAVSDDEFNLMTFSERYELLQEVWGDQE